MEENKGIGKLLRKTVQNLRHPENLPKDLKDLVTKANSCGDFIDIERLPWLKKPDGIDLNSWHDALVRGMEGQDKKRLAWIRESLKIKIKVLNGHSRGHGPALAALRPLNTNEYRVVFHGTTMEGMEGIIASGFMSPMGRSHVHMSTSRDGVYGYRKGLQVMAIVDAVAFNLDHKDMPFMLADDDDVPVVLSSIPIPIKYIEFIY